MGFEKAAILEGQGDISEVSVTPQLLEGRRTMPFKTRPGVSERSTANHSLTRELLWSFDNKVITSVQYQQLNVLFIFIDKIVFFFRFYKNPN